MKMGFFEAWVGKLLSMPGRARLSVLIYHRVLPEPDPLRRGEVDTVTFEHHMAIVKQHFSVLPLTEAVQRLHQGDLPRRALCVTFDDGYQDNITCALPVLRHHGLCASFFIASGYLDGGRMWNDTVIDAVGHAPGAVLDLSEQGLGCYDLTTLELRRQAAIALIAQLKYSNESMRQEAAAYVLEMAGNPPLSSLMMNRTDVVTLRQAGMEIGGHTRSHPILARLPLERAHEEITSNKEALEGILGEHIHLFAYPNGKPGTDFGREHVEMVRAAGYRAAVTTARGVAQRGTDPYQIPRFTPWDRTSLRFIARLAENALRYRPVNCPYITERAQATRL
jgi:peptidoglycan/xylan/chitin deacetylase (PgdA/CDA1 family)